MKHPPIEISRRAKIFSPYDALKGFSDAVAAKDVRYIDRPVLPEEERQESERTYDEFRDAYNRANALFSSSGNLADDEMLKLRELHEKLRKGGWFG